MMASTQTRPFWPGLESTGLFARVRYHLTVALRVNLFTVLPVSLLVLMQSNEPSWALLGRILILITVFTNTNFIVLNSFYHAVWLPLPRRRLWSYVALTAVLPLLGAIAVWAGWFLLAWLAPDVLPPNVAGLITVSLVVSVLYGLAFFTIEDLRRSQRQTLGRLTASRGREKEMHAAKRESELVALQARINPHFVFNTLNAIAALIHEDPDKAEDTILRLARLMRHMLEMGERTMASLETEVAVARAYLEIEKVRLGSRLQYRIDVPDELRTAPLPGMLLQPIVENAVKHGVRQSGNGGYVHVEARSDGRCCRVEVADSGPGFSQHAGTGQSMELLRRRLELIYGDDFEFALQRDAPAGETVVTLRLPLRPAPELRT